MKKQSIYLRGLICGIKKLIAPINDHWIILTPPPESLGGFRLISRSFFVSWFLSWV